MSGKILYSLVSLILFCLIINFSGQILRTWRIGENLERKKEELAILEQKNLELKKELDKVISFNFVEEMAREKLGMVKEGEKIVIMPQMAANNQVETKKEEELSWRKWWRLFAD